ncbi:MAG: RDD family protein [Acidimicrobiales bacterium]
MVPRPLDPRTGAVLGRHRLVLARPSPRTDRRPRPRPPSPYAAPAQPYAAPAQPYGAPAQPYGAPAQGYGADRRWLRGLRHCARTPQRRHRPRLLAYLIDTAVTFVALIAAVLPGFLVSLLISVSDVFGFLAVGLLIIGYAAALGFSIWNLVVRQGKTGQTIGKQKMNIMLVGERTGVPIGIGGAVLRWLLPSGLGAITCGIVSTLDLLWPLWDANNQRLVDKWMHWSVVPVPPGGTTAASSSGAPWG